ncbi:hypothetical protein PUN28_006208 [Cardiocondyla obscurior]|uniref:Uncharacterized protein n=1 Tax=Cardiocondyla obscurior TaxID=286306 RepID=A0AAW2G863_9HYME
MQNILSPRNHVSRRVVRLAASSATYHNEDLQSTLCTRLRYDSSAFLSFVASHTRPLVKIRARSSMERRRDVSKVQCHVAIVHSICIHRPNDNERSLYNQQRY